MPEVVNKTNNLSIPTNTPVVDSNGRLTQAWLIWFNNLYKRVGSSVALNNVDLENLNNKTNDNLATIANELLKAIQDNAENILNIGEKIEDFENDVEALKDIVEQLTTNVATNTSNIALNTENILQHTQDIAENTQDIIELQEEVAQLQAGEGGLQELEEKVDYLDRTYINEFENVGTGFGAIGVYRDRVATVDGRRVAYFRSIKAGRGIYIEPLEVTNQSQIIISAKIETELKAVQQGRMHPVYTDDADNLLIRTDEVMMMVGEVGITNETGACGFFSINVNVKNMSQAVTFVNKTITSTGADGQGTSFTLNIYNQYNDESSHLIFLTIDGTGNLKATAKLRITKFNLF